MTELKCNFCGSTEYSEKEVEYLYRRDGKYLFVPKVPVHVCENCGMTYYPGPVLEEIEKRFEEIEEHRAEPDGTIEIPTIAL